MMKLATLALCSILVLAIWPGAILTSVSAAGAGAGIQLIRSDEDGIVLELTTPEFTLVDQPHGSSACQPIELPGAVEGGQPGAPSLPVVVTLLGVPAQAKVDLVVTPLESDTLKQPVWPCPAPQAVAQMTTGGAIHYGEQKAAPDAAIYDRPALYPEQAANVQELGFLRSQRLVRVALFPIQVNPAEGLLLHHRRLQVTLQFSGVTTIPHAALAEDNQFEQTLASALLNYETARAWRQSGTVRAAAKHGWQAPENAYRIAIQEEGLYALPYAELVAAGVPAATVTPEQFRLIHDGEEVAIHVTGADDGAFDEGDQILFYGESVEDRYNHTNIYWLTYGAEAGKRMRTDQGVHSDLAINIQHYRATVRHEENSEYVSSLPKATGYDHWYGGRVTVTGFGASAYRDLVLNIDQVATGALVAVVEVALAGNVKTVHHLRLYINGTQVYDGGWVGRTYTRALAGFPQDILLEGANTVRVELVNDISQQFVDMAYLDWVELRYQRKLMARSDQLIFANQSPGAWQYQISNFSDETVELYDITDPSEVNLIHGALISGTLSFGDNQPSSRRYLALTSAQHRAPLSITRATPANLLTPTNGADYIIIAHADFLQAIQPLADWRTAQGYTVQVVNVQDIYDQFRYGRMSAYAIRDFLAHAYSQWPAPAPRFVLLVGDGHYDPHGYLATSGLNFIPPYLELVDPELGETATDNRYAAVAGDDLLPDLNIGRFPAQSAADVTAMVEKTLAYEATSGEPWRNRLLFVADDIEGGGGAFYNYSDAIADGVVGNRASGVALVPTGYTKTKVYLGDQCPDENPASTCQQQIVNQLNQGAFLVSYVGHGAKSFWAEERLFDQATLQQLDNQNRLSIMLPMTCLEGFFHEADPTIMALGEAIVRMPGKGAVASWSPTGFGLVSGHDYLERGFFLALLHEHVAELGAATTYGKLYLLAHAPPQKYDDLVDTFVLLGDPALRVRGADDHPIFLPLVIR
jgi:hypothetical protein